MDVQLSSLFQANQYAFHALVVGLVIISALLVYVFGFKPPVEPPFDKLTNPHDDRKANGKKRKTKEKKSQSNGHVAGIGEAKKDSKQVTKKEVEKSPAKEKKSEKKPALKENRDVKPATPPADTKKKGKGKENIEVKNKKNKAVDEKPKDFDDGEWEQAPSRKDKKNKKSALEEILPTKTEKKKDQKKKKEEEVIEQKEVVPPPAPVVPESVPEETVEEPTPAKNEVGVESDVEQVGEPKPKRNRKKKGPSGGDGNNSAEEKTPSPVVEPVAKSSPTVSKPKKETPPEPATAPKVESSAETQPNPESYVVFDELGDTWKEARAPKKGGKKKSRKE